MKDYKNDEGKIAYLIQAYADKEAFIQLVETLLDMDNCHIFVHLDKKSDIESFYIDNDKVHFISNRELVSWAGYKQGKLMFNLIDEALNYPVKFERYCFLSESDFPVYTGDELIRRIKESKPIFINCSQFQKSKVERFWFYDFGIKSVLANKIVSKLLNGIFGVLYKLKICKKKSTVNINGENVDVYCSGPFWQYDYEQLSYIRETFCNNKRFQKYFKTSFASCELMVPTIIANSQYAKMCEFVTEYINLNNISSLCYFKYTGPRVNVLSNEDYESIMKSGKPFIRKVKKDQSGILIDKIKSNW